MREWVCKQWLSETHYIWHALIVGRDSMAILCGEPMGKQRFGYQATWRLVTCPLCLDAIEDYLASETQELATIASE